jgi:uncharacterized protein (DUF433 family)
MAERIVSDEAILGGKPCIRGTRISVEMILEWFASGASRNEILQSYSQLSAGDIAAALEYAASAVTNEVVITAEAAD